MKGVAKKRWSKAKKSATKKEKKDIEQELFETFESDSYEDTEFVGGNIDINNQVSESVSVAHQNQNQTGAASSLRAIGQVFVPGVVYQKSTNTGKADHTNTITNPTNSSSPSKEEFLDLSYEERQPVYMSKRIQIQTALSKAWGKYIIQHRANNNVLNINNVNVNVNASVSSVSIDSKMKTNDSNNDSNSNANMRKPTRDLVMSLKQASDILMLEYVS